MGNKYETNYLFEDRATKRPFIVTERTLKEAEFVADAYYSAPEYKGTVSEEEIKSSALALCRRY